jgi:hypothetical protein
MLLLFGVYFEHNANASPAPWVSRNLSTIKEYKHDNKSEQEILQENQTVLIKFCIKQREDIACNFLATKRPVNMDGRLGNSTRCGL